LIARRSYFSNVSATSSAGRVVSRIILGNLALVVFTTGLVKSDDVIAALAQLGVIFCYLRWGWNRTGRDLEVGCLTLFVAVRVIALNFSWAGSVRVLFAKRVSTRPCLHRAVLCATSVGITAAF